MPLDENTDLRPTKTVHARNAHRHPLWATVTGVTLVAIGFRLGLHVGRRSRDGGPRAKGAPDRDRELVRGTAHGAARGFEDVPAQSAPPGWKDILIRVYGNIDKNHVLSLAAGVTFYSILALFPAMAALVAVYGLFADPAAIGTHLDTLSGVMPGGGVGDELKRLTSQSHGTLGVAFVVGLVTALWSANAGIKGLFEALNLVYEVPEKRGFIKLNAVSLAFTAATIGFVLLALAAIVALPIAIDYFGVTSVAEMAFRWLRWPTLLVIVMLWLAALYRFGPSRDNPIWRWVTWGSFIATVLWLVASALFTWYAANFGSYNKTYGSLGAAIGFMVWIWISIIVVLLGAEIDSELEKAERGTPEAVGGARD
jgi:membrane protein